MGPLLVALGVLAPTGSLDAQARIEAPIVERTIQDRWVEAHRVPGLVPLASHSWRVHLRTGEGLTGDEAGADTLVYRLRSLDGPRVALALGPTGAAVGSSLETPDPWPPFTSLGQDPESTGARLLGSRGGDRPLPPEAQGWDLVVRPSVAGAARWSDTVQAVSALGTWRVEQRAERDFQVVGDTVLDGRTFLLVEERSRVNMTETSALSPFRGPGSTLVRSGAGERSGRLVVDPVGGLVHARTDTLTLAGEMVVTAPDGGRWTSPVRYEAVRSDRYHEVEAWNRAQEELAQARRAQSSGMLIFPTGEQARAQAGDTALIRAAREGWQNSTDREERSRLSVLLSRAPEELRPSERELLEGELSVGDTLAALRRIVTWTRTSRPGRVEVRDLRRLLPFLADPERALAVGGFSLELLVDLSTGTGLTAQAPLLGDSPPDAAGVLPPNPASPFTPEAWAMLTELDRIVRDEGMGENPGVDALALAARALTNPRTGGDELDAVLAGGPARGGIRIEADDPVLAPVTYMARGIGFTTGASARAPLPEPHSGWEEWSEWMAGMSDEARGRLAGGTSVPTRFDTSHRLVLRYHELRHGRDFAAEWFEALSGEAVAPEATLVFGTLLRDFAGHVPDHEVVVRQVLDPSPVVRALGRASVVEVFRGVPRGPASRGAGLLPLDDPEALELLEILVAHVFEAGPEPGQERTRTPGPWPTVHPDDPGSGVGTPEFVPGGARYLLLETVPEGEWRAWVPSGVEALTRAAWEALDPRAGKVLVSFHGPVRRGPFLMLGFDWVAHSAREPNESPAGYAGGTTVFLVRTPEGWRYVAGQGWIT